LILDDQNLTTSSITSVFAAKLSFEQPNTGIANLANTSKSIKLFPNPANSTVTIENLPVNTVIQITDMQGKLIQKIIPTDACKAVNVTQFVKGLYLIIISSENKHIVEKLLVE